MEADGAAYHDGARRQRDQKRDWILRRAGWTVQRFHGSTIHQRAGNFAYVVEREVEGRRTQIALRAREEELRRQARRDALLRPFWGLPRLLRRRGPERTAKPRHRRQNRSRWRRESPPRRRPAAPETALDTAPRPHSS